jgi:hypothetical protein
MPQSTVGRWTSVSDLSDIVGFRTRLPAGLLFLERGSPRVAPGFRT